MKFEDADTIFPFLIQFKLDGAEKIYIHLQCLAETRVQMDSTELKFCKNGHGG